MRKALTVLGLALMLGTMAKAQDVRAALGPGTYVSVGATVSRFNSDYGKTEITGGTIFADANLFNRIGVEAEASRLRLGSNGMQESTYMVGPRFSHDFRSLRPYTKAMVGRGTFDFPYGYGHGSYLATAVGGGLDWRVAHTPVVVRVIDFEYQRWPNFTYGQMHPYGISAGLSVKLFEPRHRYSHK